MKWVVGLIFFAAALGSLGWGLLACADPEGRGGPLIVEAVLTAIACFIGAMIAFKFIP